MNFRRNVKGTSIRGKNDHNYKFENYERKNPTDKYIVKIVNQLLTKLVEVMEFQLSYFRS